MFLVAVLSCTLHEVEPHGRLIEPPSRSSMWRYGFKTPENYDDMGLNCGGSATQHEKNDGKCGICGDNYADPTPENEAGGKYGKNITPTRTYIMDQNIPIKVEVTANHLGWFQFRLCPNNNPTKRATPACFEQYLLKQTNGEDTYNVNATLHMFTGYYKLPQGLTCSQCILQWRYVTGNSWGPKNEEFRSCSDVEITNGDGKVSHVCDNFDCKHGETCQVDGTQPKCSCSGNNCGNGSGGTPPAFDCPATFGLFSNPSDCGSYYHCAGGISHFKSCPAGLHFDFQLQACNWPDAANCTQN